MVRSQTEACEQQATLAFRSSPRTLRMTRSGHTFDWLHLRRHHIDSIQSLHVSEFGRVIKTVVYVLGVDGTTSVANGEPVDTSAFYKALAAAL